MSAFSAELQGILAPVVAAARTALADFEDDQVPVSLRRVRASSGGRLPAPLLVSLLNALDDDPDLRERSLEHLDESRAGAAAVAFLRRGDHWWTDVASELRRHAVFESARRAEADEVALIKLQGQLDVAATRLRDARAEWCQERARLQQRARSRAKPAADVAGVKARDDRIASLEILVTEEKADRISAEHTVARLRDRLRRIGRDRRERSEASASVSLLGADPVAAARQLDLIAAAAPHRAGAPESPPDVGAPAPITLSRGIRPDQAAAIEWLAAATNPIVLLVDGYNVLHAMDPAGFTTGRARTRLVADLVRLSRRARSVRVTVVFDSSLPGESDQRVSDGIDVRFTEHEGIADDEIVSMASSAGGRVVVLTSDRDLQSRVEAAGGLALFSEAFSAWVAGRGP